MKEWIDHWENIKEDTGWVAMFGQTVENVKVTEIQVHLGSHSPQLNHDPLYSLQVILLIFDCPNS